MACDSAAMQEPYWTARLGLLPLSRFDATYIYNSLAVTVSLTALNDNVFAMSPWISVTFAYSTSSASVYSIVPFKEVKDKIKTMEAASVAAMSECLQVLANFSSKHEEAVDLYCCYELLPCAAFPIPKEGEFCVVESSSRTADVKRLLSSRSHIFEHILDKSNNYFYRLDSCVARYVSFLHIIFQNSSVIESRCGKVTDFHTTITNATAEELCKDMIRLCIKCFGDAQMQKTYPSFMVGVLVILFGDSVTADKMSDVQVGLLFQALFKRSRDCMYLVSSVVCCDPGGDISPLVSALPFLVFTVRYIVKYLLLYFCALLDLALLLLLLHSWVQLVIGWDMILLLHTEHWVPIYDGEVYCYKRKSWRAETTTTGPFERYNSFFFLTWTSIKQPILMWIYFSNPVKTKHWITVNDREDLNMGEWKVLTLDP